MAKHDEPLTNNRGFSILSIARYRRLSGKNPMGMCCISTLFRCVDCIFAGAACRWPSLAHRPLYFDDGGVSSPPYHRLRRFQRCLRPPLPRRYAVFRLNLTMASSPPIEATAVDGFVRPSLPTYPNYRSTMTKQWRELPPTKKILKQPPPKNYRITIIHYGGVIFAGRGVGRDHNFAHEALFSVLLVG